MLQTDKIKINEIIFVNHLIGKPKGSHLEFKTDRMYHYQLLYKLAGEAIITFDQKTIQEKANDVRFLPNAADFDEPPRYTADIVELGESINIGFTSDSPLPREILVRTYSNSPVLKQLFLKMQKYWYCKHDGYYYHCMSILYEIFAEISKAEVRYLPSETYRRIRPAIEYIDAHFTDQEINCDELARLCGISHTYMTQLFHGRFGMSANQYILSKKLQYACDLLNANCYTVTEISEKAGFSNKYYFSRIFKKYIGCCPSEYVRVK